MNTARPSRLHRAQRVLIVSWLLLVAILAAWLATLYKPTAAALLGGLLVLPLLLPMPGMLAHRPRTLRWAPLTLAPTLAWTVMEVLANPASRAYPAAVLAALLASFAAVIACLRQSR